MNHSLKLILALAAVCAGTVIVSAADNDAHMATSAYPLSTCIVSGDKLGEMGPPVEYTYKQPGKPDRVIQFCCKDCIKDFEKDPAKYLAKFDAATAGQATATTVSDDKMAGCCAAGNQTCCEVVKAYVPVADALASGDLGKAKSAAAMLAKQADADGMTTIVQPALAVVDASDIDVARTALKALSAEVTPLVEGSKDYVVMHCPMANADWIQTDAQVRNPYYGKMMLTCGAPKTSK